MKRFCVPVLCLLVSCALPVSAAAQASVNPSHRFYEYAQAWELKGLVGRLPPLRPYPLANIKEILETVMENGSGSDAEIARQIWEEETGKKWYATLGMSGTYKGASDDGALSKDDFLVAVVPSVSGELSFFNDFASAGYDFAIDAFALGDKNSFYPLYTTRPYDYAEDPASIWKFTAFIDTNDVISVGTPGVFFQGGLSRRGYGPFLGDGTMLSDNALHTPNFSITAQNSFLSYTQLLSVISATTSYDGSGAEYDKYYAFHAIELTLFKGKFSVAYAENIIFGRRFDPSYLLPIPYMAVQTLYGASDNLQMGLVFSLRPVTGLQFSAEVFVDDMDVNNMAKLNFNTRNRFNFRAGAVYAPEDSICSLVQIDYMAIAPFMYTHWEYDSTSTGTISVGSINYSNYTHYGKSLATEVPPDSDRVYFKINLNPFKDFRLSLSSSFTRHGNVAESFTDEEAVRFLLAKSGQYATDGSIFTHSMFENTGGASLAVIPTGHNRLNFLTQDHLMYVIQAGLSADYTFFRAKWGTLSVTLGYDFECAINKGVDSHLYPGGQVSDNYDGTYTISGVSGAKTQQETVAYFKELWKSNMRTVITNYVTLGIRYTF